MKNKVKVLICIIVLLIVVLGIVGVLYLNEIKDVTNNVNNNLENLNEIKNETSKANNYLKNLNGKLSGNFGINLNLDYAGKMTRLNEEADFSSYYVTYHYTGEDIGKLFINEKEVNINGAIIQDMCIGTNYDGLYMYSLEVGETYNFVSTLYILFNNGTIGKISTEDIKNEKYSVTMMREYKDIKHFIEVEPTDSGADTNLWAVNENGNVFAIDMVRAGA